MSEQPSGNLLHNLVLFGRLLRSLGMDVNPGRLIDLVQALSFIDIGVKDDFYHAACSLLVHRHEDLALFDQAFSLFWRQPSQDWINLEIPALSRQSRPLDPIVTTPSLAGKTPPPQSPGSEDESRREELLVIEVEKTYSDRELLRVKDFSSLTGEELEEIKRLMSGLIWQLGLRRTRRKQPGYGRFIDFRRTIRGNLRYGGEVLFWARRQPRFKPRPLVVIADISGSMERYTRLLLHFIYGLARGLNQHVEAFVFSTRLTHITTQLRTRDIDQALYRISRQVPDWSGGTRIGEALKTFNHEWARRVLGRGAVVLLISDGWDRGDVDLLSQEMARLQRSCFHLIWLNPLLGSPQYEPLTRGIQAALPYIDDFLPVHNLASLDQLASHLAALNRRK